MEFWSCFFRAIVKDAYREAKKEEKEIEKLNDKFFESIIHEQQELSEHLERIERNEKWKS